METSKSSQESTNSPEQEIQAQAPLQKINLEKGKVYFAFADHQQFWVIFRFNGLEHEEPHGAYKGFTRRVTENATAIVSYDGEKDRALFVESEKVAFEIHPSRICIEADEHQIKWLETCEGYGKFVKYEDVADSHALISNEIFSEAKDLVLLVENGQKEGKSEAAMIKLVAAYLDGVRNKAMLEVEQAITRNEV